MISFKYCIRKAWRGFQNFERYATSYLARRDANFVPLTPITLLNHTVLHHPNTLSYIHGKTERTWLEVFNRTLAFSNILSRLGIKRCDVVSIIAPNTVSVFEAHFAIPSAQAVLHTINIRQDPRTIAYQLQHAKTKVIIVDSEYDELIKKALSLFHKDVQKPIVVYSIDTEYVNQIGSSVDSTIKNLHMKPYILETMIEEELSNENFPVPSSSHLLLPRDEWDNISLNYTSGTTGNPKGVVYHHRGAYLNAINNIIEFSMTRHSKYLWIVPMFHCNGWCFPWTMAAVAGTSYFLRQVRPEAIYELIEAHGIRYMCGAPVTMNTLLEYKGRRRFGHEVNLMVAGAPPPPAVMARFERETGVTVRTAYGLTETYGPISTFVSDQNLSLHPDKQPDKDTKSLEQPDVSIAARPTFQTAGVMAGVLSVKYRDSMTDVPADGETVGEVMMRGNVVMKGYLGNEKATEDAFEGGWFHTGDLAVLHPNNRIELRDRSKDIIISGGENISSIEVENAILTLSGCSEAAVVALEDPKWGEVPCGFVVTAAGVTVMEEDVTSHCMKVLAGFKVPKKVIFVEKLPKTATGKIQKRILRKYLRGEEEVSLTDDSE